jgi:predicted transcriptional regulator of viral defense system
MFADHGGVMRTGEALVAGVHRRTLYWMRDHGKLESLGRGVFVLASGPLPESPDVAAVMRRIPKAVLCLVSALEYHGIGTQIPNAVQVALPRNVRPPKIGYPRVQVFNMSEAAFRAGVEEHAMAGARIRVFGVAKTVADCFKYRNRIGLDVAVEALQAVVRHRIATPAEIMEFARIDRVESVLAPYLGRLGGSTDSGYRLPGAHGQLP